MVSFDSTHLRIANGGILAFASPLAFPKLKYFRLGFVVLPVYYSTMKTRHVYLPICTCFASLFEVFCEPLVYDLTVYAPEQLPVESSLCTGHYKIHIGAVQCPEVIQYHLAGLVYLSAVHFCRYVEKLLKI